MAKHQIDVADDTGRALENTLAALRAAGMPDDAKVRIRTRASFSPDGAYARSVTASWTDQPSNDDGGGTAHDIVPAVPPPISHR